MDQKVKIVKIIIKDGIVSLDTKNPELRTLKRFELVEHTIITNTEFNLRIQVYKYKDKLWNIASDDELEVLEDMGIF